jgi:hypothetical protein
MSLDFCTRLTEKIAKLGYDKKPARRFAQFCYLAMTFTCGLFGLFEREKAAICLIAGFGMHTAGTRAGTVSPASSLIRR